MLKYLLFICILLIGCTQKEKPAVFVNADSKKNIRHSDLSADTLLMDSILSSYLGNIYTYKNNLLFIDKKFCYCYIFDNNGHIKNKYLGKGHSNSEVPADEITGYTPCSNGDIIIFSDLMYYVYDSLFNMKSRNIVKTGVHNASPQDMYGANPKIYSWNYDKFIIRQKEDNIYHSATIRTFSPLENMDKYFSEGRTILQVNLPTGNPQQVIGRYPPIYQQRFISQFCYSNFDIDAQGNFYISYEADSLIYKYDTNFINIQTFGLSGKDMDCNYQEMTKRPNLRAFYLKERETKGFYDQLEYIDPLKWLCRIYRKGTQNSTDGLQIYDEKNILIYDINIPKNYHIAGYISPNLYLYNIDENKERFMIIKLKINSL